MHLLRIDITDQRIQIRRPNGERSVSSLPRELRQAGRLGLEPFGRGGFELFHQLRYVPHAGEANSKVNVIRDAPGTIAFAFGVACDGGKIRVKRGTHGSVKDKRAIFCAEDHMDKEKRERLWHREDYRSGLRPSFATDTGTWGVAPCWYKAAPTALSQRGEEVRTPHTFNYENRQRTNQGNSPQKSAEGATLYQPGAAPQVISQTNSLGLKARPILLTLCLLLTSIAHAQTNQLKIRIINAKTNQPVPDEKLNVALRVDQIGSVAMATDKNGIILVDTGNATIIRILSNMYADCRSRGELYTNYSIDTILKTGITTGNLCSDAKPTPKPGELILFEIPRTFIPKMGP